MKKLIFYLTIIAAILVTISTLYGQDPAEITANELNVKNSEKDLAEAKKDLLKAQSDFVLSYQKFRKGAEIKIAGNEISIADVKSEIMQMNVKDNSAKYQKEISDIELKNKKLKKALTDYINEGPDEWKSFKSNFNRDLDELVRALKDLTINDKK